MQVLAQAPWFTRAYEMAAAAARILEENGVSDSMTIALGGRWHLMQTARPLARDE